MRRMCWRKIQVRDCSSFDLSNPWLINGATRLSPTPSRDQYGSTDHGLVFFFYHFFYTKEWLPGTSCPFLHCPHPQPCKRVWAHFCCVNFAGISTAHGQMAGLGAPQSGLATNERVYSLKVEESPVAPPMHKLATLDLWGLIAFHFA